MLLLSKAEACKFYSVHEGKPFYDKLITFMASGKIVAMELIAVDAVAKWRTLIGPTDSTKARAEAPHTLRAKFGTDNTKNACHGSDAVETAAQVHDLANVSATSCVCTACRFTHPSNPPVANCTDLDADVFLRQLSSVMIGMLER
jgi:nucleoside diphosphate kinase